MFQKLLIIMLAVGCICAGPVLAKEKEKSSTAYKYNAAVAGKVSTLGMGVDFIKGWNETNALRLSLHTLSYGYDTSSDGIDYDGDLDFSSWAVLWDWYPFEGYFRTTAGILMNNNEIKVDADSQTSFDIGDVTFTPAQVGTLVGKADFNKLAPYLGVGWGDPIGHSNRWSLMLDVGFLFSGAPDASLVSVGGTLSDSVLLNTELAKELDEFEDDIEGFDIYPVISLAFAYQF